MKLSKQRQAYLAMLAIGVVALIVDRLYLGPSSADASAYLPPESGAEPPAPAPENAAAPAATGNDTGARALPTLAARLREASERELGPWTGQIAEAFRPSDAWREQLAQTPTADGEAPSAADRFRAAVQLQSVLSGAGGGAARLRVTAESGESAEQLVRVGQVVAGFRLEALEGWSATFVNEAGERVQLSVQRPDPVPGAIVRPARADAGGAAPREGDNTPE